jgi:group I intron endonuclease
MNISKALLKYGYSNFSLLILKYCKVEDLLKREKDFIDLLSPKYNISQEPSSPMLGLNHSAESRAKMSASIKVSRKGNPNYLARE